MLSSVINKNPGHPPWVAEFNALEDLRILWYDEARSEDLFIKNIIKIAAAKLPGSKTRVQGHKAHGLGRRVQGSSLTLQVSRHKIQNKSRCLLVRGG